MRKLPSILCLLGIHARSAEQRRRDRDGLFRSTCRRCGVAMVREKRTRRWLAMTDRDQRRRTRKLRHLGERMTGPVLFLLLLALVLGITVYLRGPSDFWQ